MKKTTIKNKTNFVVFCCLFLFLISPQLLFSQCDDGQVLDTYCYDDGEVNNIAFEVCPSAGMAIQSNITQGSFFNGTNDNLTIYSDTTGSSTTGTILFGPSTGNVAGNTITSLGADQCLIFVINSNTVGAPLSCTDGTELELQVCSESVTAPAVNFVAPADLCITAGIQNNLNGGIPTGGVYNGPGVIDDGNGMTYSFDPVVATAGVHTISYTVNGNTATDDIEVFATGAGSFTALADLCIDAGLQTGLGGAIPTGGVYSGPGITDDGNGMTYSFNPAFAGLGVHTITYTETSGCLETSTDNVEVLAACGCPVGQTSFFHCSEANESDLVIFEICPTAGMAAQATIIQGTYNTVGNNLTIYQGASGSGIGGTIIYGPQMGDLAGEVIMGNVADQCLIFVNNINSGFCQNGFETPLQVCGESIASSVAFTAPNDVCIDDGVQANLSGGSPTGGVYSGPGVTDNGDGMTYDFDPAAATIGTHTLIYTLGGNFDSDDVDVIALPTASFTAPADLCIDAGEQTELGGAMPIGGVYSGPGVTDNGDGMTYDFNPAVAGIGIHTITYTESSPCMETASDNIEVTVACSCPTGETTYFNCYDNDESDLVIFEVCPTAGQFAQANIAQGTYNTDDMLTVYQGTSGSGIGGTIVFGPTNGNLAGNTILSTIADECLIFVNNTGPVSSCSDGFSLPLIVCGISNTSNVTFTALPDISVNAGIQTGLSGGLPTGGVYSGPGVTDNGNGMTYTFDPAFAGVGIHTLTYTVGGASATDDVEVLNLQPPSFSKSFNPNEIAVGSASVLNFTISNNSGDPLSDVTFTDNLPAGMMVATPANITSTCFAGTITAVDGSNVITLIDGEIPGSASCVITVNVVGTTTGTLTNTTGDLTSSAGNSGTASANLTVASDRPTVTKSFAPSTVNINGRSTMTFTIDNSAGTFNYLGFNLTDNLPSGMVIASPANATSSCSNMTLTAVPGASTFTVAATQLGLSTIPAGTICTITVDVLGTSVGTLNNVTNNVSVFNNFFQTINLGLATASLEVMAPEDDLILGKSFIADPVTPGSMVDLEFTITNQNRDFSATNIAFTDDLTTVLAGLVATGLPLNDVCGTGSQISGTSVLSLTGGTLAPESTCTFTVTLQVPAGAASGAYNNITNPITGTIDGAMVTGNTASDDLFIQELPNFTKTFLNDPILAGGTTTLEFTIENTSTNDGLTDLNFTDGMDFLSGATIATVPAAGSCGAGSVFFVSSVIGTPAFNMTGGNIPAGGSCTFSIDIIVPAGTASQTVTNTTSPLSGLLGLTPINGAPATDDLTILAIPELSKSFINDPVLPGDIVDLEFTISYPEDATGDATNLSFTDDLNAVIAGMSGVGLPLNNICGTGSSISGTTNLTFSGGTLSPGSTCTFTVQVQVPASAPVGTFTNTTSNLTSTVAGMAATSPPATANLLINTIEFTKEFIGGPVIPGELTTLRFTINNLSSNLDATAIIFTDNLGGMLSGTVAEAPLPTTPCGAGSTVSGTSFIIFVGGTVAAGTMCSFDIPVRIPLNANPGTYTNVTSNLSATIDGASRVLPPALAELVVENNYIQLSKSFTNDPVLPGNTVDVEYTITNLDPINALSDIAFTVDFDALITGLSATGLPQNNICGIGSNLSGSGLMNFTGGNLAAGASCTFTVTLQTPATAISGTTYNCPTSTPTGEIDGLPVVGDAAADDLSFLALEFSKSFAGPVIPGETTTLTFSITNVDPSNSITDIAFIDDLDAFISGMVATNLPLSGICGTVSGANGTSIINFGRGELAPNETCTFDIDVLVPCATAAGTYTNTTGTLSALGVLDAGTASADLTVSAPLAISITGQSNIACNGDNNGTATASATGGSGSYNYAWSNGDNTAAVSGLAGGIYTVSVTDSNNCGPVTTTVTITEPTALSASIDEQVNINCNGTNTGGASATASGGTGAYSYLWSNGTTDFSISGVPAGTYTVSITDANSCGPATTSVTLTEPTVVGVSITAQTNVDCNGSSTGSATASGSGGTGAYSYVWSNGAITATNSNLTAGTYTVSVTDANGCGPATTSVTITEPSALGVSIAAQTNVDCNGSSTGSATASGSGGTGAYSYVWSNGAITATNSNLTAGTYTVSVTDANGCGPATTSVTITEPTALGVSIAAQTNVDCNGSSTGSATASGSGGTGAYSYVWSNGATTATNSNLTAGTYTVSVTDAINCGPATTSVTITEPTTLGVSIAAQTNVDCNGSSTGSATAAGSGGTGAYSYVWDTGGTTATISNLSAGTYTVSVTDGNSCGPATTTVTITEQPLLEVLCSATDALCNVSNGTATATPSGGTGVITYLWSDGQTTMTATGLSAGIYTVTTTDALGCTDICMSTVVNVGGPSVSCTSTPVLCDDINGPSNDGTATATASGGTGAITYLWSDGQTTMTATGLSAGIYTATVTDMNSCTNVCAATVVSATPFTVACASTPVLCDDVNGTSDDGTATATASGGIGAITYLWSDGQTTMTATGLSAGSYTATVTDGNGCTNICTATVASATPFTVVCASTPVLCDDVNGTSDDGTATATASGGTGAITYLWSDGQTTMTATGLSAGSYTATVTDGNGCINVCTATVASATPFAISCTSTSVLCDDINGTSDDGTATATVSGGTGAITYLWSNGQMTMTATGLTAGTYTATVTDGNGCINVCTATVASATPFTVSCASTPILCDDVNGTSDDGTATATVSGGTGAITYLWSDGQTTMTATGLSAGSYTATVTDGNGCINVCTATVASATPFTVSCAATPVMCDDINGPGSDGTATATTSGGTGVIIYLWSDGQTTMTATGLSAGSYTATVTDGTGCTNICTATVGSAPTLTVVCASTPVLCDDINGPSDDGTATATASGGTGVITYLWSDGQTTMTATDLSAGSYTATVTDGNGCTNICTATVASATPFAVSCASTPVLCDDIDGTSDDGTATATVSGGIGAITYLWSNGQTTMTATGLTAGTYTATVTDGNNCTNTCSTTVEAAIPLVILLVIDEPELCIEDTIVFGLGGGTPLGGFYSGTGVIDDGNGTTFSFDPTASAPTGGGSITVLYTIIDDNGCTFEVLDDIFVNPICCTLLVTCPSTTSFDIECESEVPDGTNELSAFTALGGTIDDSCNPVTITILDTPDNGTGCLLDPQEITREFTISDLTDGVSTSCTVVYNIADITPPVLTCPANVTIGCEENYDPNSTGEATAADNCTAIIDIVLTFADTLAPLTNGYAIERTWKATDECGNLSSCVQIISVLACELQIEDPCACLNNSSIIDLDAGTGGGDGQFSELVAITSVNGGPVANPNLIFEVSAVTGGVDAFTLAPIAPAQTPGVPIPVGTQFVYNPVTMHYELPFYHYDNLGYSITIQQVIPGSPGLFLGTIGNVCVYPQPTFDPMLEDLYCPNDPAITLGGIDPSGLGADVVNFTIDNIAATELNPAGLSLGSHTVVMTWDGAVGSSNGTGTLAIPNQPGCIQTVQKVVVINDTEPPVINCPSSMFNLTCNTEPLPAANTGSAFVNIGGTIADNCSALENMTVSYVDSPASPALLDYCSNNPADRTITRTYTISDELNNASTCTQNFVYNISVIGPVITLVPLDRIVDCASNVMPQLQLFEADADCKLNLTTEVSGPIVSGTPNCPGTTYEYTYTAQDACNRIATHTQTYTIQNDGPTLVCPPGICIIECTTDNDEIMEAFNWYAANATVTTSCSGLEPTVFNNFNPNGFFNQNCNSGPVNGVPNVRKWQSVTFTAIDACGQTSTCTRLVVIVDNEGPVIEGTPYDVVRECDDLNQIQYDAWVQDNITNVMSATDNCGEVEWSWSPLVPSEEDCANGYAITEVEFMAIDGCGNMATRTAQFKLKNSYPPSLSTLADITVECGAPIPPFATPTIFNACGITTLDFEDITIPGSCPGEYTISRTWTVIDGCGASATTVQNIRVVDTTPPNESDFVFFPSDQILSCDEYPPASFEEPIVMSDCGEVTITFETEFGTGNPNGCFTGESFDWKVIWIATDACGNSTSREQNFFVDPNLSVEFGRVSGEIFTEGNEPVEKVIVNAMGNGLTLMNETENEGRFEFDLPLGSNYGIEPTREDYPLNGISTIDLIILSQHVLGIQTLNSPYKMIAADINNSGTITAFDMLELRKLILFTYDVFPENNSWKFVEENFVFDNTLNPFASTFPMTYNINDLSSDEIVNFIGIKIGDLDGSAHSNVLSRSDTRIGLNDLEIQVDDEAIRKGEAFTIDFKSEDFDEVLGFQFTIDLEQTGVEFMEVKPGRLKDLTIDNFGFGKLENGALTISWNSFDKISLEDGEILFSIVVNSKRDLQLSEVMSISSRFTKAEAYRQTEALMNVTLEYKTTDRVGATAQSFFLYQNQPNPFKDQTIIGFQLPESSWASLSILDASGRLLKFVEKDFAKGYNEIVLSKDELNATGVLYYELKTSTDTAIKKMIHID